MVKEAMVSTEFFHSILKELEKFLIKSNGFHLDGENYNLILLVPSEDLVSDAKYSLLVSSKSFDQTHPKHIIRELLNGLKNGLKSEDYNSISRINVIHSEDALVKNLNFLRGYRTETTELKEIIVGGIELDHAFLIKSLVLDKLIEGHALKAKISDVRVDSINMGVIRIEENFEVVYYTGKGLKNLFEPNMTADERQKADRLTNMSEDYLIANQYIDKIPLDRIDRIF